MSGRRFFVLVFSFALVGSILFFSTIRVEAQTTGSLYGTVTDPSGASVPGATVTVTNLETQATRSMETDGTGRYFFPLLLAGRYELAAQAEGFKRLVRTNIELDVESSLRFDVALQIGAVTESIEVSGQTPLVETATSTVGKVVEARRIRSLPLNGRNFLQLGVLQPGVAPPVPSIDVAGSGLNNAPGGTAVLFSVNGMRITANNHLVDGANNVEPMSGAAMVVPSPDAIDEFRILTNMYAAEYGRSGGSIVTVLTKGGANSFHGSVYDFLRNDVFDARNFFASEVPALKRNQFGGTFGGPIHKNKTFFFVSYEGLRERRGIPTSTTVPSDLLRQGDFSGETVKPIDPSTGSRFPNDVIPPSAIDPVALQVLALYPKANLGTDVWTGSPSSSNDRDQLVARFDHSFLGGRNNLSARYILDEGSILRANGASTSPIGTISVPGFEFSDSNRFQNVLLSDTHLFSNGLVNEIRVSYQRAGVENGLPINPIDPATLGFSYPIPSSIETVPQVVVFGFTSLGYTLFNSRTSDFYQLADNIVIPKGRHSFKIGGEIRHSKIFGLFPSLAFGAMRFTGAVTGHTFADFLLGRPFLFVQVGGREDKKIKQTVFYGYVQDDFRVTDKLMLNLGLRYELVPGFTERDDLFTTFIPGVQSTQAPTLPTGLLVPGDAGVPQTLFPTEKANFAPRVGLAWDPWGSGKTAIRAGYGLFFDESALVQQFTVQQPPHFQPFAALIFPPSFADPFLGTSPFTPPLQFPLPIPGGFTVGLLSPDFQMGEIQHWNLTVQHQLSSSLGIELAYAGNKATHLQGDIDPNQAVLTPTATRADIRQRRPFDPIGAIFEVASIFNSNYHGFQATLTQRPSQGLSFQAAYTFSKGIDNTTKPTAFFRMASQAARIQNMRDLAAERGLSAFDLRHRFVLSGVYELPSLNSTGGRKDLLLGGWELSGIVTLQSGYPLTVFDTSDPSFDGTLGDRPNLLRDPNLPSGARTPDRWFDTGAFERVIGPAFGNAGRNITFTDGIINFDFGLAKNFPLDELRSLQFRWEVFNAFNHTNFGIPDTDLNSGNFGKVFSTLTPERQMQFVLRLSF